MLNFGFKGGASGDVIPTNCLTPLIQLLDGGYGKDDAQAEDNGTLVPEHTSDGQLIYTFSIYDTGEWILRLGVAGDEQSPNSEQGVLQFNIDNVDNVLLIWNEANKRYEGDDVNSANALIAQLGVDVCFRATVVPLLMVHYDYSTVEVIDG